MSKIKKSNSGKYKQGHFSTYSFKKDYLGGGGPGYRKSLFSRIIKVVILIVALVAAIAAGYFLINFLKNQEPRPNSSLESQTTIPDSIQQTTQAPTETETEPPPADNRPESVKALWIPENIMNDDSLLSQFIGNAKSAGINAVVFDVKRADGTLSYDSKTEKAVTIGSVSSPMENLSSSIAKLNGEGILPIARIYCFRDPIAPRQIREAAVFYDNSDTLWLDKSPSKGGKPWLNPYSEISHDYILDIMKEIGGMGAKNFLLEAVQFPSGNSANKATFGPLQDTMEPLNALSLFVEKAKTVADEFGGNAIVGMTGISAVNGNEMLYGGNLLDCGANMAAPNFIISDFPKNIEISDKKYSNPVRQANAVIQDAASAAYARANHSDQSVMLMPWLLADSSVSAMINTHIGLLNQAGINSYILYADKGRYDFEALSQAIMTSTQ